MDTNNKNKIPSDYAPWLSIDLGEPTTKEEKEKFRFEYAHESKTEQGNTIFWNVFPES